MRLPDDWPSNVLSVLFIGIILLFVPAVLWGLLMGIIGFFTELADGFGAAVKCYIKPILVFIHFDVILHSAMGAVLIVYFLALAMLGIGLVLGVGYLVKSLGSYWFKKL